ncbi:TetR/AcrR family transcriptional regulator [Cohnella pontilimi]|uniref:TetR/AcrR family transcriptional regulator n=1 Tax=Cohnella pontilimi TaxID=2564100 RepID=A0A4U0FHA8_9BACL|nr:TetR/AcrR family transcriptional regulator [Cohnella pontilimi]TJY44403.1 TetR/AcrR family transcriptional regulator [Cohnella pontilimi]
MGRKRDAVVETGKRLFLAQGIAGTSMDQIAEAVPVSKMTLYNIFGSKEGLLEAVLDSILEEGVASFDKAMSEAADPLDALNRLASIEGVEREMSVAFLQDLQAFPELLDKLVRLGSEHVMPRFHQVILEGQQKGQIRKDLSPIVIVSFLQAMKDFLTRSEALLGVGNPQTIGQQLTTIFYHGILTNESKETSDG